jgi:hypothetical protein
MVPMTLLTKNMKPLVDLPEENPAGWGASFDDYASNLGHLLISADPPALTVGVFGGYGSGKTTLMKAIDKTLEPHKGKRLVTVWFQPWRYDHEEHLFLPFLATLARHVAFQDASTLKTVEDAFRAFLYGFSLKMGPFEHSAEKAIDRGEKLASDARSSMHTLTSGYFDAPAELGKLTLPKNGKPTRKIVVFIDDLDRCLPSKAFALLEAIKSWTDLPGFLYVIGLDPRVIETYLLLKYGPDFAVEPNEYLQKMIQVPFSIPDPEKTIRAFLTTKFAGVKHGGDQDEVVRMLTAFGPENIRQLKRIMNTHQVLCAVAPDLNSGLLIRLLILQFRWPIAYWVLRRLPNESRKIFDEYKKAWTKDGFEPSVIGGNQRIPVVLQSRLAVNTLGDKVLLDFFFDELLNHDEIKEDMSKFVAYLAFMEDPIGIESELLTHIDREGTRVKGFSPEAAG